jgi:hypothetical protein
MHLPIKVKSPNNISKWQMEFNSAFKWLREDICLIAPSIPFDITEEYQTIQ